MLRAAIFLLTCLFSLLCSAQSYSNVRGCWLKEIVLDEAVAEVRFGRGANGFGFVRSQSSEDVIISHFRLEQEMIVTESSPKKFDIKTESVRLVRGQVITFSGSHASCRISWIEEDGQQGVEVVASDTSGPGFKPYTIRTFLPLRK